MIGTKILATLDSKFNGQLRVVKTFGMGTYIQAGGLTQSGGIVESIWKSTLRQIKGNNKDLLILGLGGGTLGKLLRKKYPYANITGVEIDPLMIDLGKKYLNLNEYGIDIKVLDVNKLKVKENSQDLIIVDMYQGDNFPKEFESEKFLNSLKNALRENGTLVINRLYFGEKRPDTVRFGNKLEKIFRNVKWFYPEANLMLICKA